MTESEPLHVEPNVPLNLIEALRLLAASPLEQRNALPDWVAIPDEVAMTFGDAYDTIDLAGLPPSSLIVLEGIDRRLSAIQAEEGYDGWDAHALESSESWQELRELAKATLEALGATYEAPRLHHVRYVKYKSLLSFMSRLRGPRHRKEGR